jgi:hypothetical protein
VAHTSEFSGALSGSDAGLIGLIGLNGITLTGAPFFSVETTFFSHMNDMLNLRLNRPLKCDEATGCAAAWLFVQVIEVPALLQLKRKPVQRINRSGANQYAANPEKNGPEVHATSPISADLFIRSVWEQDNPKDSNRHRR